MLAANCQILLHSIFLSIYPLADGGLNRGNSCPVSLPRHQAYLKYLQFSVYEQAECLFDRSFLSLNECNPMGYIHQ